MRHTPTFIRIPLDECIAHIIMFYVPTPAIEKNLHYSIENALNMYNENSLVLRHLKSK